VAAWKQEDLYQQLFAEMERGSEKVLRKRRRGQEMEVASKKGWRAVFASGRWDDEGGREVKR